MASKRRLPGFDEFLVVVVQFAVQHEVFPQPPGSLFKGTIEVSDGVFDPRRAEVDFSQLANEWAIVQGSYHIRRRRRGMKVTGKASLRKASRNWSIRRIDCRDGNGIDRRAGEGFDKQVEPPPL